MRIIEEKATQWSDRGETADLLNVFSLVWKKKSLLFLSTFCFFLVGSIYAYSAKEDWSSTAVIGKPLPSDLGDLLRFGRILNPEFSEKEFSALTWSDVLLEDFARYMSSVDAKKNLPPSSEVQVSRAKDAGIVTVEFHSTEPRGVEDQLGSFISVSQNQFFKSLASSAIAILKEEKGFIERKFRADLENRIASLEQAINTARAVGLKRFQGVAIPSGENFLFLLGEDYLRAQVGSLRNDQAKSGRYDEINEEIEFSNHVLNDGVKGAGFPLQSEPTPRVLEKPRRGLIIVFFSLLGLVFGFWGILAIEYFRKTPLG